MTGTSAYDAEALNALRREKPSIATTFATRCSDRSRVRDCRLAQLSRDVTLTYSARIVGRRDVLQGRVLPALKK